MKTIITNKEGLFNNEVLEKWQTGIVLSGQETKATKLGQVSLKGSFIQIDSRGEVWLINSYIGHYKPAKNQQIGYNPSKKRKLLLNRKEIDALIGKKAQKGLTIIPISLYTNKRLIKVEIALVRGKTKLDKREIIKKREIQREIKRTLKQR